MSIGGKMDTMWCIHNQLLGLDKSLSWLEENSKKVLTICHLYKLKYTQIKEYIHCKQIYTHVNYKENGETYRRLLV